MSQSRPLAGHDAGVWRLGADVDTDALAPGHAMKHGVDTMARYCLEQLRPDFAAGVRAGDVLVAGPNFGIGSSREQAASVLVALGVAAVIAPSYSGLYFRNAFNVGLLLLTCPQAGVLEEGERIAFDARSGRITRANGEVLAAEPIADFLLAMAGAGGLLAQLQQSLTSRKTA
ncbi:MAG: 3-isopropylmalate dehydratase [Polaromonas sp.]|uniref:LeuD/DmdB family oxidoreductase small subunit n=1 Tax=Polaromonas sp. TaxID=1869339 RepID=UPI00273749E4|nr:3-isopropylmalate dehydratase [Polaromonas sp.]MDP2819950.1 3-isopropylmalate dehydratase [Polaromonas sp.]